MSDVFISYATADREAARKVAEALVRAGWSVWWDRTIPIGRTWDEVIEEQLDSAACVVVLWSRASTNSSWVKAESAEAMRRGVLVPALIEETKIPLEFRRLQAADLSQWKTDLPEQEFQRLVESITSHVSRTPNDKSRDRSPFTSPQGTARTRRSFNLLWVVAMVLVLGISGFLIYAWQASERHKELAVSEAQERERLSAAKDAQRRERLAAARTSSSSTPSPAGGGSPPKDVSPPEGVRRPLEDALLGHWISTFENPLFSVIDISREGSEIHILAYVNNRGPDKGGCVYDAILDGKRGVVAKGKNVEWQLPTLPLPCANWVQEGFTGASILVASAEDSPNTLATVVNMYAGQRVLGGSGPQKYIRK